MNTISINWIIKQLSVKKTEGEFSDVVITAIWSCRGSDGTYGAVVTGTSSFAPPTEAFTPYPDLTQDQVLGWCFSNGVDQKAIEANVTAQINDQINAPVIAPPLPWLPPVDNSVISAPPLRDEQSVDPFLLPTSDVPPSVDGMSTTILG